jgi:16S rRNA (guanine527-N7)-methyltransferase
MERQTDTQTEAVAESILGLADQTALPITPACARILAAHVRMVYEAGRTMNLTTVPLLDAAEVHVVDSLLGLAAMERGGEGAWADLGSGAGFPGIPLAVAGERRVDLIESVRKKAEFLSTVVRELCLDVAVRGCRAEEAAQASRESYAAVSARAVGQLSELLELASPLLRVGGVLVAWKGQPQSDELSRAMRVARLTGMALEGTIEYELPRSEAHRCLIVFRKERTSSPKLPRRPGMARSKPLA